MKIGRIKLPIGVKIALGFSAVIGLARAILDNRAGRGTRRRTLGGGDRPKPVSALAARTVSGPVRQTRVEYVPACLCFEIGNQGGVGVVRKVALIAICLAYLSGTAFAQDAKTVIANAQKALGDPQSITYSGSAKDVAFQQCGANAKAMVCQGTHDPMRPIDNYVRVVDLSAPAPRSHPDRTVVVYANTSAAVKARADWVVTSSIAVELIEHLDSLGEKIIWAPDRHLGSYVQKQTGADKLTIGGCLGPCALANVALLLFDGRALWLHSMNTEARVLALYDRLGGKPGRQREDGQDAHGPLAAGAAGGTDDGRPRPQ